MLSKLKALDAEFREWQKQNNIDIDKDLDGDWYGIGLAANSVVAWMKAQKHFAYLIEIKGDDGWKLCEVAVRFNCSLYHKGGETPTEEHIFKVAPPWLNIFINEYPEVNVEWISEDGHFDTIGERMGINCSVKDVEEDGGTTTGYDNCGCRFRVTKKEVSGEWSEKTKEWLARFPLVTLEME